MPGSGKSNKPVIRVDGDTMFQVAGYHDSRTMPDSGTGNMGTTSRRYRRAQAAEERKAARRAARRNR